MFGTRNSLLETFWFVPTVMAAGAGLAAVVSTTLDDAIGHALIRSYSWAWSGSAEGARSVLGVIAGSTMTVAGVVFSITVTALAQTSSHFGPRVLRNFTADRGNQLVLGTFISTFVFCLLVLRSVRAEGESGPASVPFLSVNIGLALAVASIGVLIYFIHHVTRSLQVEVLLASVGAEFDESLKTLFPEEVGQDQDDRPEQGSDPGGWESALPLRAGSDGYVQSIDQAQLMRITEASDLIVRVAKQPGAFVSKEEALLRVQWPGQQSPTVERELRRCVAIGAYRTPREDISYSVQQLVEVAARGLSPGTNEIFTALSCIDWLGSALESLARRRLPAATRTDRQGRVRVVAQPTSFIDLADMTLGALRPYAADYPLIAERLIDLVTELAPSLRRLSDADALQAHVRRLGRQTERLPDIEDRQAMAARMKECVSALQGAQQRLLSTPAFIVQSNSN